MGNPVYYISPLRTTQRGDDDPRGLPALHHSGHAAARAPRPRPGIQFKNRKFRLEFCLEKTLEIPF